MRGALRAWWPAIVWMGVIGVATSARLPIGALGRTGLPLDKVAHLVLYGVLGWTIGRALWVSDHRTARAVWIALAAGLLFGAIDEWHQGTLPYRQTSVADWLADAAGVSLGLAAYLWPRWLRGKMTEGGRVSPRETDGRIPPPGLKL